MVSVHDCMPRAHIVRLCTPPLSMSRLIQQANGRKNSKRLILCTSFQCKWIADDKLHALPSDGGKSLMQLYHFQAFFLGYFNWDSYQACTFFGLNTFFRYFLNCGFLLMIVCCKQVVLYYLVVQEVICDVFYFYLKTTWPCEVLRHKISSQSL